MAFKQDFRLAGIIKPAAATFDFGHRFDLLDLASKPSRIRRNVLWRDRRRVQVGEVRQERIARLRPPYAIGVSPDTNLKRRYVHFRSPSHCIMPSRLVSKALHRLNIDNMPRIRSIGPSALSPETSRSRLRW